MKSVASNGCEELPRKVVIHPAPSSSSLLSFTPPSPRHSPSPPPSSLVRPFFHPTQNPHRWRLPCLPTSNFVVWMFTSPFCASPHLAGCGQAMADLAIVHTEDGYAAQAHVFWCNAAAAGVDISVDR